MTETRKVEKKGILRIWEPDPLSKPYVVLFNPTDEGADNRGIVYYMQTGEMVTVIAEEEVKKEPGEETPGVSTEETP